MKKSVFILGVSVFLAATIVSLRAQTTATTDSIVQMTAEADGLKLMSAVPTDGTFWIVSAEGITVPMPFLPTADQGLPIFAITNNVFLVDASGGQVDLQTLGATTTAEALEIMASQVENVITQTLTPPPATTRQSMLTMSGGMEPMGLLGGIPDVAVYLTNLTAILAADGTSMTASFSIAGGTNGFAYDIYSTTNLANSPISSSWTWIGQGYTSNSYTFTNQPSDQAFYILAVPQQTMVVAWGRPDDGQCDVPPGLTNVIDVSAGYAFSLALKSDGTVVAWGDNTFGETNVPVGLSNVTSIAAGGTFALTLLQNGTIVAWGDDTYGVTNVPAGLTNVVAIAAGYAHALALRNDGTVVAWGYNGYGQTNVPATLGPVSQIAGDFYDSVVLLTNGTVVVWGYNGGGYGWNITNVPPGLSNVVSIAGGGYHTLALKADGTVTAWGAGTTDSGYLNFGQSIVPTGLSNVVAISGGGYHSVALQADGTVAAWGWDLFGQTNVPGRMTGTKAISAGGFHTLAVRSGSFAPLILEEPSDQYAPVSGTVTFSALGGGVAGVSYQWQFNGVDIPGATNATLILTNVSAANEGSYQVVISNSAGSVTSDPAALTLILPPQILSVTPTNSGTVWTTNNTTLSVLATDNALSDAPLSYQWQLNGTNLSGATTSNYLFNPYYPYPPQEGNYTVIISNAAGSTNVAWNVRVLLPGMVAAWGDDTYGECDRPVTLSNAVALAAGEYHSVAVQENGTVIQWGTNWGNVPVDLTNAVAVAAGYSHSIALRSDGTVVTWGVTNDPANYVPANLSGVKAVACGWNHNVALLTNGTVIAWGQNSPILTNVPPDLTNAIAVSANGLHSVALRADGTVEAWGFNSVGETNVPAGLSNVVAIAAGKQFNLALEANGTVVGWGDDTYGQTNVPAGLSNVMAIAAGDAHAVALKNDGTVVAWGDNTYKETNVPSTLSNIKLIAAGGYHTLASMFLRTVQYPVDVTRDLLLIYNTNSADSATVLNYYLAHRPMVSGANVLGIGYSGIFVTNGGGSYYAYITNKTVYETITPSGLTNQILAPVQAWLNSNPTKRPQYVILFLDVPSRVDDSATTGANYPFNYGGNGNASVSYQLATNFPGWSPFVTHINMNGTNDCIAYIKKLADMDTNNSLVISANARNYGNANYVVDDSSGFDSRYVTNAITGLTQNGVPLSSIIYASRGQPHITQTTNVAGYISWGVHSGFPPTYAIDGTVQFTGNSGWYPIETIESFNGQRYRTDQGTFVTWFSSNAFGGTNYSNTPVGAVSHTDEPGESGVNDASTYFGLWAAGKDFAICAWASLGTSTFQAVGDPWVTK